MLGNGKPGGSWHRMEPNLRTLSLSTWMSLPNLSFDDWLNEQQSKKSCQCDNNDNDTSAAFSSSQKHSDGDRIRKKMQSMSDGIVVTDEVKTRALVQDVAKYYENYVRLMKLDKFFRNDTVVVSVRQVRENEKCKFFSARWVVHG